MAERTRRDQRHYHIVLTPDPAGRDQHGRDPEYRLRLLLKYALRQCGLRCVGWGAGEKGGSDAQA